MSEEYLVQYCAPTLAGIKTGNLFSCVCDDRADVNDTIRSVNLRLGKKGLRLLLLRFTNNRALLYLYRPSRLRLDLSHPEAKALLEDAGYEDLRSDRCVGELIRRLRGGEDFPHEIGLFLSYPPEDVRGFIENRGRNCILCGLWKVYGNAAKAANLFHHYQRCTDIYRRQRTKGVPIDRLAVAEAKKRSVSASFPDDPFSGRNLFQRSPSKKCHDCFSFSH